MLAALAPASVARHALPARRADQARGARDRARRRDAGGRQAPTPRTCASWPGRARARSWPGTAKLRERPGAILDGAGRTVGRHRGQHLFTIGQRKGLGVGAADAPLYVLAKDRAANTVTVGTRAELATTEVAVRDAVLHRPSSEVDRVKLRYRTAPLPCRVAPAADGRVAIHLDAPVDGAAPGQVACLMRGDAIVGHGVIAS